MNRYAFRIHYDSDPRRIGHIPMSGDEVQAALRGFCERLPGYLQEMGAQAEVPEALAGSATAVRIAVLTALDWERASVAVAGYADRHGLRATHVAAALAAGSKLPLPAPRSLGALLSPGARGLARRGYSPA